MSTRKNSYGSESENFKEIAGEDYKVLLQASSPLGWEYSAIVSGEKGIFVITQGQPDRGAPYVDWEKINDEDAKLLQEKPSFKNFKKLVSRDYFNESFFADWFEKIDLTSKKESEYLDELIEKGAGKIKNTFIKRWYVFEKFKREMSKQFSKAKKLREIPFQADYTYVNAFAYRAQFNLNEPSDLEVVYSVELPDESEYRDEKHILNPDTGELKKVIKDPDWFKSLEPGTEFPIEEKTFASSLKIIVNNQGNASKDNMIEVKRGGKKIYSFSYPKESFLSGFRIFNESDNKCMFIIPMRNHLDQEHYIFLTFKYESDQVKPAHYLITRDQESAAVREDYKVARVPRNEGGTLGSIVEMYEL